MVKWGERQEGWKGRCQGPTFTTSSRAGKTWKLPSVTLTTGLRCYWSSPGLSSTKRLVFGVTCLVPHDKFQLGYSLAR